MKQIFTLIVSVCLFASTQNLSAQCSASSTNPNPAPGFSFPVNATAPNGFSSSDQNTLGTFPKNKMTSLTSPDYYYLAAQSTIYFKYTFSSANSASTSPTPSITITYGSPTQTVSCTAASPLTIVNGGGDYYFSIPIGTIPGNTFFKITLTMDVPNDKAITAVSLSTNAILAGSGAPLPLPVKLANFSGSVNQKAVQLQWGVAENETVGKFEIQRSVDGGSFTTAGVVWATNKQGKENYSFSEISASEKVQYRLKIFDKTARAEYSKILVFMNEGAGKSLRVMTNPVREKLAINFNNESPERAQLNIYDNLGRVVQKQSLDVAAGNNTTFVVLNGTYKAGLYMIEVVTKTGKLSGKIIYSNQ
jgi:hypothetical protein